LIVEDTRKEMIFLGETVLQVRVTSVLQIATLTLFGRSGKGEPTTPKEMEKGRWTLIGNHNGAWWVCGG
jgi:hypothetical protein